MRIISDQIYWNNLPPSSLKYEDLHKVIFPIYQTLNDYKENLRKKSILISARKTNKSICELEFEYPEEILTKNIREKVRIDILNLKKISIKGIPYQIAPQPNKANQFILQPVLKDSYKFSLKVNNHEINVILKPILGTYIELDIFSDQQEESLRFLAKRRAKFIVNLPNSDKKGENSKEKTQFRLEVIHFYSTENSALVASTDLPNNFEVKVEPNYRVIETKLKALLSLLERPKVYLFPLMRLFEKFDPKRISQDREIPQIIGIERNQWQYLNKEEYPGVNEQREFVIKTLNSPDFAILEGPPGSGKTTTILEILHQATLRDQRIILVGSTHIAVDNVLERIHWEREKGNELQIFPIRIGHEGDVSEIAQEYLYENIVESESNRILTKLKAKTKLSEAQKILIQNIESNSNYLSDFILNTANVICGTTIGILDYEGFNFTDYSIHEPFDMMIIDEASKTTFQEFLVPALLAKKWIIIGDKNQLSPFIESGEVKALENRCILENIFQNEHQWMCSEILNASKKNIIITDVTNLSKEIKQNLQGTEAEGITLITSLQPQDQKNSDLPSSNKIQEELLNKKLIELFTSSGGLIDYQIFHQFPAERVLNAIPIDLNIKISPRLEEKISNKDLQFLRHICDIHNRRRNKLQMKNEGEIKSWIEEVQWRLTRMYELRHQAKLPNRKNSRETYEKDLESLLPHWNFPFLENLKQLDEYQINLLKQALRIKVFYEADVVNKDIDRANNLEIKAIYEQNKDPQGFFKEIRARFEAKSPESRKSMLKELVFHVIRQWSDPEGWMLAYMGEFPDQFQNLVKFYIGNEVFDVLRFEFPSIIELLQSGLMVEPKYRDTEIYRCTIYQGYKAKEEFWKNREVKLSFQHRMHPDISKFIREKFYQGNQVLDPDGSNGTYSILEIRPFNYASGARNVWVNVPGKENSKKSSINLKEVEEIFNLYKDFESWAQDHPKPKEGLDDSGVWKVAILTFYLGQELEISKKFLEFEQYSQQNTRFNFHAKNIELRICVVDRYQGQEADVILISLVRTKRVGFLDCLNRLNVGLSRAKYYQIIVGNKRFFHTQYMKENSQILYELASELPENYRWSSNT